MKTILIGGPADMKVIDVQDNAPAIYWPEPVELWQNGPADGPFAVPMKVQTYQREKIFTPDRWTQVVFIHTSVDKAATPEHVLIQAIMRIWRAQHKVSQMGQVT